MLNILSHPSPHFDERQLPVDMLVLHYTDMPNTTEVVQWFQHPNSRVSAHYLIDEDGSLYQFVDEDKRAWHAGQSFWQGVTDINSCSIGIELANPGHSHGYQVFPDAQIQAFLQLAQDIQTRWAIPAARILAHSDIAPTRKQDPGHLFPWKTLAKEGLGLWPEEATPACDLLTALAQIGYDMTSPVHTITAFQRRFQPHKLDGIPDEETHALVQGLLNQLQSPI